MEDDTRNAMTECYECKHMQRLPWNCHIACGSPSLDVLRNGSQYGRENGWFSYPFNFDPVWKQSLCHNFEAAISPAISQAVSPETEPKTS